MDYKKIIKSKKARIKILHLLSGIPDKPMISLQYYIKQDVDQILSIQNVLLKNFNG